MAYSVNTAANIRDLLSRMRSFVLVNGWVEVYWNGSSDLVLKGTGDFGYDEIYIRIRIIEDTGNDIYNFRINAGVGWNNGELVFQTEEIYTAFWDNAMDYWLVCNGRRIILFAKVSTKYTCMHLGFFRPFSTPEQYPYPLMIGGTKNSSVSWTSNFNYAFWSNDATSEHRSVFLPDTTECNRRITTSTYPIIWPKEVGPVGVTVLQSCIDNIDGSYTLLPLLIYVTSKYFIGQIEGLYHVSGHNQSAENTLIIGGDTYVIFPKFSETDRMDWVALQLK